MKKLNGLTSVLALTFVAASCGQESKKDNTVEQNRARLALFSTSLAKLAKCDASTSGSLAYVSDEEAFYVCEEGNWKRTAVGSEQAVISYLVANVKPKTESAVLDIECSYADGSQGRGTGTKINDNQLITAWHVVDKAEQCLFRSNKALIASGGLTIRAKSGRDIVIIEPKDVIGTGWSTLASIPPVVGRHPAIGNLLMLASLPENLITDKQYTFGHVTDDQVNSSLQTGGDPAAWRNAFMSDMAAAGGSSGAPVFNASGEFIGVHVGGYKDGLELNFQLAFEEGDFTW